ncbi:cytochrome c oxidase assembly protein [uncultured Herbaspirillum sp.]|uniref:cytochrome c oxidase assembly protein n=1 Tax=uncultured Herbaspirillum sp. TaxID=160236 RepID=UPI00258B0AC3|nr:cytochrome c oxidase assembly protein [uncultured Herbaspirillum sp.]
MKPTPDQQQEQQERGLNRVMLRKLVVVAVLMFGFGYALIPVYRKICEVTGVNFLTPKDATVEAPANSQVDKSRVVTVEFDGNAQGPWRFRPTVASLQVHPGEMTQVTYEVVNTQARNVDAQAIPSYAPQQSAAFFKKVECFCFTQQTLGPNQAKQMPVVFYIDPKLPKDVTTITLSYTFFEINGKDKTAKSTVPTGSAASAGSAG